MWVTLIVAGVGLAGVLFTQWRADQRDDAHWDREREAERERWAREDTARTFDHRREAYVDLYESVRELALVAYDHCMGLTGTPELDFDWQLPTFRKLQHLRLYASPRVSELAGEAYNSAWYWGNLDYDCANDEREEVSNEFHKRQLRYDDAEAALLDAIRVDLGIPD